MNENRVVVYGKPSCVQCTMTYRWLDQHNVGYTKVDITETPAALEYITEDLGYSQAPVVVDNTDDQNHWSGFRPDKLDALTH